MVKRISFGGHDLSEFHAKMQSFPEISSCKPDVGVFQGVGRSTLHVLQNRRTERTFLCYIDFFGNEAAERAQNVERFERLFVGNRPVEIDISDGYVYDAVLTNIEGPIVEGEILSSVEYTFRVVRRGWLVRTKLASSRGAFVLCQSSFPRTDCIIRIDAANLLEAESMVVSLGEQMWSTTVEPRDEFVLDGINKVFTMAGKNITGKMDWRDFPYLVPGVNHFEVGIQGIGVQVPAEISYYPTFL